VGVERRDDDGRGCAAGGKVSTAGDGVLEDALPEVGGGAGGSALDEACADGLLGFGVGEEQVFDDLLDGPLAGRRGWQELGLGSVETAEGGGDFALKGLEDGVHRSREVAGTRYRACADGATFLRGLLEVGEGFFGGFGFFAIGVELEVGLVLGDGLVFFLHLLSDLGEGEVSGGVVGLDGNSVFCAEVGALVVFVAQVEPGDGEVLVDAFVVGLNSFDLGELAVDGGSFGHVAVGVRGGVGRRCGVVTAGA
jgi:hypothetical protein